jgi:hypothetical protein
MTDQPKNINWKGYTKKNRNLAIHELKNIIGRFGYILEYNLFSDMALSLIIEIEERKINSLYNELNEYISMEKNDLVPATSDGERVLTLHVTFSESSGDLEHLVPDVPG